MEWVRFALSIMVGLITAIPLVIELIKYVKKAVKEKNWSPMLKMVLNYMIIAEDKFKSGAERKEWVLTMVKASADTINYDIDLDVIGKMIDDLCDMSKAVNAPTDKAGD